MLSALLPHPFTVSLSYSFLNDKIANKAMIRKIPLLVVHSFIHRSCNRKTFLNRHKSGAVRWFIAHTESNHSILPRFAVILKHKKSPFPT